MKEEKERLCEILNSMIKAQWEVITPEVAAEMLQHRNKYNRSLKKRTVDSYARDMKNNRWKETGEPIIIDSKGIVANGHHRLNAIVQSGSTVVTLVVRGVDPESIQEMDQQAKRTAADVFSMDRIENAASLASIVKAVLEIRVSPKMLGMNKGNATYVASMSEIRDEYLAHKNNYNWAGYISRKVNETNKLINPRIIGSLAYILLVDKKHPKEKVEEFFYQFADQRDFCSGMIRQLRQKLTQDAQGGQAAKLSGVAKRYYLFKTWNLYVTGKTQALQGFNKNSVVELI